MAGPPAFTSITVWTAPVGGVGGVQGASGAGLGVAAAGAGDGEAAPGLGGGVAGATPKSYTCSVGAGGSDTDGYRKAVRSRTAGCATGDLKRAQQLLTAHTPPSRPTSAS
jgi:hypothetical protein